MKLTEVSAIEIKTFSVENTRTFDGLDLHHKLDELDSLAREGKEECSLSNPIIEPGNAFERAMNAMYDGKGNVALIIEKRVITLDKSIQRSAIRGSF